MSVRIAAGVLASAALLLGGVPASWAQGGAASAVAQREFVVFAEVLPPYERSRMALQKQLKTEGYESSLEGEREIVLVLTEAQIASLFQAKVRLRKVEGSATAGLREVPYLEGARIPARFEKLIRRVYFDPQRS